MGNSKHVIKFIRCKLTIYKQLVIPCVLTDNDHFIISIRNAITGRVMNKYVFQPPQI